MSNLYWKNLPEADRAFAEQLQQEAEAALPADKGLSIHLTTIETLRAKGYTYREIAKWLNERGIKVNHVDVWRAHKNGMDTEELFEALEHDGEWSEFVEKKADGSSIRYQEKTEKRKHAKRTAKSKDQAPKKG